MLFCNAHIVIAKGILLTETHHARAFAHGRCDAHQARVLRRHVTQPLAKDVGERWLGRDRRSGADNANSGIKFTGAVVGHRIGFCFGIALAFACDHMQKLRARLVVQTLQGIDHRIHIVPIHRACVLKA